MKSILRASVSVLLAAAAVSALTISVRAQPCSDLFISEYVEGTSFNKAIEIYNPTSGTLTLDGYRLYTFNNGSPVALFTHGLHGQLGPGQVYVICHPQADTFGLEVLADTISLVCNWNGNDAVALVNTYTGDTIDVIGVIGEDPGTSWPVDVGSTQNSTLVRKAAVQAGTTDWALGQTQYTAYAVNDFSHLGFHQMDPCPFVPPSVLFLSDTVVAYEADGAALIPVGIVNPNANATGFNVQSTGGTADPGMDYSLPSYNFFPPNSSQPLSISMPIVDDNIIEPDETVYLELINPTNGATIIGGPVLIIIKDSDAVGGLHAGSSGFRLLAALQHKMFRLETATGGVLVLLDASGRRRLQMPVAPGRHEIDLRSFPDGVYLLTWLTDNCREVHRLVLH